MELAKSNFLSLFEMLGNLYEKRLALYVAQMGGVNKFFYQGLKQTEKIEIEIGQKLNSYVLSLMESDGKLLIAHEKLGYSYLGQLSSVDIGKYQEEAGLKDYDGMRRGDYIKVISPKSASFTSTIQVAVLHLRLIAIS